MTWKRRTGVVSMAALSFVLLGGADSPQQCNDPQPSHTGAEVGAVAVVAGFVVGVVVLVEVHKHHHEVKGCVSWTNGALSVRTNEGKTWALSGDVAGVKPGDLIKVHGNRVKPVKGSPAEAGDPVFTVQKMERDYGVCKAGNLPTGMPPVGAAPATP